MINLKIIDDFEITFTEESEENINFIMEQQIRKDGLGFSGGYSLNDKTGKYNGFYSGRAYKETLSKCEGAVRVLNRSTCVGEVRVGRQ